MPTLKQFEQAARLANKWNNIDLEDFIRMYGPAFLQNPEYYSNDFTENGYWGSFDYRIKESILMSDYNRVSDSDYEDAMKYAMSGIYKAFGL